MRILNWVQSKINGKQQEKKPEPVRSNAAAAAARYYNSCKEEFNDWPNGLLAIGTFGNSNLNDDKQEKNVPAIPPCSSAEHNLTPEEVDRFQRELAKLLSPTHEKSTTVADHEIRNKPTSGLEFDLTTSRKINGETDDGDGGELSPESRIVLNRAKEMAPAAENGGNTINKRSFSFLFKKMFTCKNGFAGHNLRDPLQASIMEKLLKAIVHKKIYPQNPTPTPTRKYLEKKLTIEEKDIEEEKQTKADGSKWVKTDSEYIVLEI